MKIAEVEIHEFEYALENVGHSHGHQVYDPDSTLELPGFVLTIRTDEGVEGHYRGFLSVPPIVSQVKMAASGFLIERDPLEREGIWYDIWQAFRHTDNTGLGAIDIALWDLAGNYYGESIASLLGGYRERIPAYASTYFVDDAPDGLNGPEAFASFAEECREEGYPAFKIHGHPAGRPARDIEICRAVADAVGDEMDLMLDVGSGYRTYADTLRVGRVLDELGFFWYEDPMADTGKSMQMATRLGRELDTPLLGMEKVRTGPFGVVDNLEAGAADFVRASASLDGGITGAMKIARVAEAFGTDVEFLVGEPAHLHCLSAVRNTNYFEHALVHPQDLEWMASQGFTTDVQRVNNGFVSIPDGAGLGVEIDWSFVSERQTEHTVIDEPDDSGIA